MGVYLVSYSEDAGRQLRKIKKAGDKAVMSKIQRLVAELSLSTLSRAQVSPSDLGMS